MAKLVNGEIVFGTQGGGEMCAISLISLAALFVSVLTALILTALWAGGASANNGYVRGVCAATAYDVSAYPTPCATCCIRDSNGYCLARCNCWLGSFLANVSTTFGAATNVHIPTGTFSEVSQADMIGTLQNAYPLGQNFTCYANQNVRVKFALNDVQGLFIAAMVMWGMVGVSLLCMIVFCKIEGF